ncbi:sterol-binding domain-containing protein [Methyloglobulus morosus KoM1]|uniref:Ubiquinone biosynthesis accessory factor UbiJ n=1 Tax=Methyloglobulus morosus KoM1 TaxID=1116472 RepID=V5BTN6_9GAMM|nr:SCP2 sterol-binding domain-containing protein [Methyloglobulus morosus]ESS67933.1 sterol-binding domain-containing protein [Methyloglobulus morosus KoM1]
MLIKPLLIATLETALNRYLALDNNKEDLLIPLKGKVIALTILPFNETLYLCPTSDSIQIIDQITGQPDTTISGSAWALGLMGISAKPMRSVFSGEIKIEGDIQTGKQFQAVFKKLDIDLEGLMAQYTGHDIASKISQFFRSGQKWGKETIETFKLNAAEFLQEETRDLPAEPEIELFYRDVDTLRNDSDRLECRIERLAQHLTTK